MAATIIQFPQQQSVAFMNLTQLVELASDNLMGEGYAKLMEDCYRKSEFRPGEFETLQEQIRKKRLENAKPKKKPAVAPTKPGLYCYTSEMGDQKPDCQIEVGLSCYDGHYHISTPLELKGRGIKKDCVFQAKNLCANYQYMDGWFEYSVTKRAFEKLKEQYTMSLEILLD